MLIIGLLLSIVTAIGSAVITAFFWGGYWLALKAAGAGFALYWIFAFLTYYGTKPLEWMLDSAIGNFMRFIAGPVFGVWILFLFFAIGGSPRAERWSQSVPDAAKTPSAKVEPETAASPPSTPEPQQRYRVSRIKPPDSLNIRTGPGSTYPVAFKLPANARGITLLEQASRNGTTLWQEIDFQGRTGWVNSDFLIPDR